MIRTTITIDEELDEDLDAYIAQSGSFNRSEAIRDLIRRGLNASAPEKPEAECLGVMSYTIDQQMPGLAKRTRLDRLNRHDEFVSVLSVPVDHSHTLDVVVMRGRVDAVSRYANQLFLERGVRHGNLGLVPVATIGAPHDHGDGDAHIHMTIQESF